MPIYNGMWRYRPGWEAQVSTLASTARGDASTAYRFNLCSHTGTYIETSQHKLDNDVLLDQFAPGAFVRPCTLAVVGSRPPGGGVALEELRRSLGEAELSISEGDSLIVATGWGPGHRRANYLGDSPHFEEDLVEWLCGRKLHLLGVDIPAIESARRPCGAVRRLFEANPRMLLLAPLVIDPHQIKAGRYLLSAAPLKVESVSACLCRALLLPLSSAPVTKRGQAPSAREDSGDSRCGPGASPRFETGCANPEPAVTAGKPR